jgi:hypothetical protein
MKSKVPWREIRALISRSLNFADLNILTDF